MSPERTVCMHTLTKSPWSGPFIDNLPKDRDGQSPAGLVEQCNSNEKFPWIICNRILGRDQTSIQYKVFTGQYLGSRQALGCRVGDINGGTCESSSEREDLCILYCLCFSGKREVLQPG